MNTERLRVTAGIVAPDKLGPVEALKFERTIANAQTLSFRTMADSLLQDISGESLPPRTRVIITLSAKKAPSPLAKVVAEEYLERLGLASQITLELADKEEIEARLNPDLKPPLTQDQIEARRAVMGYSWKRGIRLEDPVKAQLKGVLEECQKDAVRAREELITDHMDRVTFIARKYKDKGIPLEELIAEGNIDLVKIVGRFDWRRGFSLFAFAERSLDGKMKKVFRDKGDTIRQPRSLNEHRRTVLDAYDILTQELGYEPSIDAIVERTGLPKELIEEIFKPKSRRVVSLDISVGSHQTDSATTGLDLQAADFDTANRALNNIIAEAILARLSERDREILIRRFILDQTQSAIAKAVGISQMHVSRILSNITAMIQADLHGSSTLPIIRIVPTEQPETPEEERTANVIEGLSQVELEAVFVSSPTLLDRDEAIARMLHAGDTPGVVASRLGISVSAVRKIEKYILFLQEELSKQNNVS